MVLCEKIEKNSGRLQPGVFERFERACQAAEPDADRSDGNGGKSVVFRKNIGNFRVEKEDFIV